MLALVTSLGCEGSLKDGELLDTPVATVSGTIQPAPDGSPLGLGVVWVDPIQLDPQGHASGSELVKDRIASDGTFSLDLYGPPPAGSVRWLKAADDSDAQVAFAWGEFVLFEDRDGDGTFTVGSIADGLPMLSNDVYRGTSSSHVIVYVEQPLDPARSVLPSLRAIVLEPGYHVGSVQCRTEGQIHWVVESELDGVPITLGEPSNRLQILRECLTSLPAAAP